MFIINLGIGRNGGKASESTRDSPFLEETCDYDLKNALVKVRLAIDDYDSSYITNEVFAAAVFVSILLLCLSNL